MLLHERYKHSLEEVMWEDVEEGDVVYIKGETTDSMGKKQVVALGGYFVQKPCCVLSRIANGEKLVYKETMTMLRFSELSLNAD